MKQIQNGKRNALEQQENFSEGRKRFNGKDEITTKEK